MRRLSDLFKGSAWNLGASVLASVSALAAVPWLGAFFGWERVGLILLGWGLVGLSSIFDLGVTRSLIRGLSLAASGPGGSSGAYASALVLLSLAGVLGAGVIVAVAELWLEGRAWRGEELGSEVGAALPWLWLLVPLAVLSAGARAPLEAERRFGAAACARSIPSVLGVPSLLLLPPSARSMTAVVLLWCMVHALSVAFATLMSLAPGRELTRGLPSLRSIKALISEGSWIVLSTVVSPFLALGDRYAMTLAAALSAVAAYTIAHDLAVRLLVIPKAICAALLPIASTGNPIPGLAARAMRWVVLSLGTLLLLVLPVARELLDVWIGTEKSGVVAPILSILCAGLILNAVAHVPVVTLQAQGRARAVAWIHLAEVVYYGLALGVASRIGSVEAFAWSYVTLQALDLLALTAVLGSDKGHRGIWPPVLSAACVGGVAVALALIPMRGPTRVVLGYAALAVYVAFMYTIVAREEVQALKKVIGGAPA